MHYIKLYLIIVLSLLSFFSSAQDTTKARSHLVLSIIPSNILVGEVPFGVEYTFRKKRISVETSVGIKCFDPLIFYKYDNGFKTQNIFKISLIRNTRFLLNTEAIISYKKFSFKNKEDIWVEKFPNTDLQQLNYTFEMNRSYNAIGGGVGFGLYFTLLKRMVISTSIHVEYYKYKREYTVTRVVSGDLNTNPNIILPFHDQYSGTGIIPNFLFRIGYEIF